MGVFSDLFFTMDASHVFMNMLKSIEDSQLGMVERTKLEPREEITSRTLQNDNIFRTIPR